KMEDKVGLTLACLNLKKLVKRMAGEPFYFVQMRWFKHGNSHFYLKTLKKTNTKSMFAFNLKPFGAFLNALLTNSRTTVDRCMSGWKSSFQNNAERAELRITNKGLK
ncbi:IS5/IS1182 family transposase, partial [Streptococcus dysgalactiae subsp. equisimilis]|nr:IS5/IS1182 family transposase [Streptococcus dysgalactiae subsp. equisimilis]